MKWDPTKYTEFADYRGRPYKDLLGQLVDLDPKNVVDLGCGPGNMTRLLARRWPAAQVVGLDSSQEMIDRASSSEHEPNLQFGIADATTWQPEPGLDLLISNAMLQWLPEHRELLATWLRAMKTGSYVAIQVPGNFDSPSHVQMREVAESPKWVGRLGGVLRHGNVVGQPDEYQRLLLDAGFQANVWESTFQQLLLGEDPILDWVRGTALLPVKAALNAEDYLEFEDDYRTAVSKHYPSFQAPDGTKLTNFPFRRIFMIGHKLAQ
ncbi:methyltransferase domain-containing protein [Arthrobacter sp. NIO-1057]|uniref:methyltransferase domain-containing protein n=1 Tax=Arthrobacter sp. NIO-1057 TaxID=993071 RepID=UPI00071C7E1C|nr:methyltransferase domain-containing protein [Arthrobacter sp. NIO-1057]KSU68155.1 trans-aconitate methyltransferase [Arthrobacter sp. NIO-1057]SCB90200.1 trans-aconitate 2-methyltransferase [Arthrobacter sp. NIO-1057]